MLGIILCVILADLAIPLLNPKCWVSRDSELEVLGRKFHKRTGQPMPQHACPTSLSEENRFSGKMTWCFFRQLLWLHVASAHSRLCATFGFIF